MRIASLITAVLALTVSAAWADTITVCWDGSAEYLTIQGGIDAASNGDEVVVCPGTYNELINFNGKAITLRSSDGRDVTTIDGTGLNNSVVKCVSGEGSDTVLEGFRVANGTGDPSVNNGSTVGGGMRLLDSDARVVRCIFESNIAQGAAPLSGNGGGVHVQGGAPSFLRCVFESNMAERSGGGVRQLGGTASYVSCIFQANRAGDFGGGAYLTDFNAQFINTVFFGNFAQLTNTGFGGGIGTQGNTGDLRAINCTFVTNSPQAIWTDHQTGTVAVANSIVQGQEQLRFGGPAIVTYSNIAGGWPGTGNINVDPRFVNAANGNFRLAANSPCIDAGDNTAVPREVFTDLSGNPRFIDDRNTPDTGVPGGAGGSAIVDMGPYERQLLGDLNCDGTFNGGDIDPFFQVLGDTAAYIKAFPNCDFSLADMNGDGFVNGADIDPFFACLGGNCP